jgi:glutamate-1-semialdehyde aminotransferase
VSDRFATSRAWWERAERVIPMGTQTLSKSPTQWVQGTLPIYLERGQGSHVWDVDGNEFIDYPMSLGPVILGHAEPAVNDAIAAQLQHGITFTMMHPLEVEVAERIVAMVPGVEAVRFGKSGSDALSAAIRAARAYTGRDLVLVAGYHGWHDWYIGTTTRNAGVPVPVRELSIAFPFNDLDALGDLLKRHGSRVAAVTLEPSGAEVPAPGYLQSVVDLAHEHGAVAVFDEIITGFRLGRAGARERYGVLPDISCYGKALGNGMPISAVAGTWQVMQVFEDIFFSGTHGGETLSLAAAKATLDMLADGSVHAAINQRGRRMLDGITRLIEQHDVGHRVRVGGEPERAVLAFPGADTLVVKSYVQQTLADHGALFNGGMFICYRHTDEDVDRALAGFDEAFGTLAAKDDVLGLLRGAPVQPVFRNP